MKPQTLFAVLALTASSAFALPHDPAQCPELTGLYDCNDGQAFYEITQRPTSTNVITYSFITQTPNDPEHPDPVTSQYIANGIETVAGDNGMGDPILITTLCAEQKLAMLINTNVMGVITEQLYSLDRDSNLNMTVITHMDGMPPILGPTQVCLRTSAR